MSNMKPMPCLSFRLKYHLNQLLSFQSLPQKVSQTSPMFQEYQIRLWIIQIKVGFDNYDGTCESRKRGAIKIQKYANRVRESCQCKRSRKCLFNLVPSPKSTCNDYQIFCYFYQNTFSVDVFKKLYLVFHLKVWFIISYGNKYLDAH